jgi:hypothetical protein
MSVREYTWPQEQAFIIIVRTDSYVESTDAINDRRVIAVRIKDKIFFTFAEIFYISNAFKR